MKKLRVAYLGSPDFSAYFLEKMLTDPDLPAEVVMVITPEDKPVGRKGVLTAVPVTETAHKYNVPVVHSTQNLDLDIDLILVFAYGKILPKDLLNKPKYGCWNMHPSLLPLYRGPSPMASPLIEGKSETGVTLMKMDEQIDHGPIIAQEKTSINPKERHPELAHRLSDLGYGLFKKTLAEFITQNNSVSTKEQNHAQATITKTLKKQDGFVEPDDFAKKQREVFNRFRGLYPWPGLWTKVQINGKEQRLKITDMDMKDDKVVIKKVQLEGKNEVGYDTFLKAYNQKTLL